MTSNFIQSILASPTSLKGQKAAEFIMLIAAKARDNEWIIYKDRQDIETLAKTYVDNHAYVTSRIDKHYGPSPIHVFEVYIVDTLFKGLLYANGTVIVSQDTSTKECDVTLYIDKDTARLFQYPEVR